LGNGLLLSWTPFNGDSEVWHLQADGTFGGGPRTIHTFDSIRNNQLLVSIGDQRVLEYSQPGGQLTIWGLKRDARGTDDPLTPLLLRQSLSPAPGGRGLVALEADLVLTWDFATGDYGLFRYREGAPSLERFEQLGNNAWFRRGHRLISLGANRLLSWDTLVPVTTWDFGLSGAALRAVDVGVFTLAGGRGSLGRAVVRARPLTASLSVRAAKGRRG